MRTPSQAAAWFRSGTPRTINNGDWEGGCAAAVYNGGGFTQAYAYALGAAVAAGAIYAGGRSNPSTGSLNRNYSAAGDGAIHYWGGIWNAKANRYDGHVGLQYGGLIYMASVYARRQFGNHLGASTWLEYNSDRGLPYLGWSSKYGKQSLAGVSTAGLNEKPLDNSTTSDTSKSKELTEMIIVQYASASPQRNGFFLLGAGLVHQFTGEEWGVWGQALQTLGIPLFNGVPNDRAFDLIVQAFTQNTFGTPGNAGTSADALANLVASKVPAAQLQNYPTNTSLGQSLTQVVTLINDKADLNKEAIISEIDSHSGSTAAATAPSGSFQAVFTPQQ